MKSDTRMGGLKCGGALLALAFLFGCAREAAAAPVELVVAADGSAKYRTVQEAVMAVPAGTAVSPVIIRIRPGTYRELVYVQREKRFFHLVGEDAAKTIITYDLNANLKGLDGKPIVRNVHIENVTSRSSPRVMWVVGFPGVTIDDIHFRNCTFRGVEAAEVVSHAGSFSFENVTIEPARKGRSLNSPQGAR